MPDEITAFIEKLSEKMELKIKNQRYKPLGLGFYTTEKDSDHIYYKLFLNNHHVLVFLPSENEVYFGEDIGAIDLDVPAQDLIDFDFRKYKLVMEDYQKRNGILFGREESVEGNVKYWDYECVGFEDLLLSLAVDPATGKRSDTLVERLPLNSIEIVSE